MRQVDIIALFRQAFHRPSAQIAFSWPQTQPTAQTKGPATKPSQPQRAKNPRKHPARACRLQGVFPLGAQTRGGGISVIGKFKARALDGLAGAGLDPGRIIALFEPGGEITVDHGFDPIVKHRGIAFSQFNPHLTVIARHQYHNPVIALGIAHAPMVEQTGRKGFNRVKIAVICHAVNGHDRHFNPAVGFDLLQQGIEARLSFRINDFGKVIDVKTGVVRVILRPQGHRQDQQKENQNPHDASLWPWRVLASVMTRQVHARPSAPSSHHRGCNQTDPQ